MRSEQEILDMIKTLETDEETAENPESDEARVQALEWVLGTRVMPRD